MEDWDQTLDICKVGANVYSVKNTSRCTAIILKAVKLKIHCSGMVEIVASGQDDCMMLLIVLIPRSPLVSGQKVRQPFENMKLSLPHNNSYKCIALD